jgi:hypothetical protein
MKTMDIVQVRLSWVEDDPGPPAPHLLRGAIGDLFRTYPSYERRISDVEMGPRRRV